jgi:MAternally affected uncoordination
VLRWGLGFGAPPGTARVHPRADRDAPSALSALSTGAAAAADLGSPQLQLFCMATKLHLNLLHERRNQAQSAMAEERGGVSED